MSSSMINEPTLPPGQLLDRDVWWRIAASIDEREDRLIKLRRRIHATPEPAHEEFVTTQLVAETLRDAGLSPRVMDNDSGVVADVDLGATGGNAIALRAELDCVNVNDDKQVPYASTRPGLCHACGHDVHTTVVLGAVAAIAEHRDHLASLGFRQNLRCIFQPAEESSTGAREMIRQGAIDGVDAIIAVHVDPFIDAGIIGVRRGPLTSACKSFRVRVRGRSGHSARPHEAVDPIPAAISIVSMWYQLCPRSIDSRCPLALTVASITAGTSHNAIPDEATICGTLRTTRVEDTEVVQRRMESVVRGVGEATGCDVRLEFPHHNPPTDNDGAMIDLMAGAAREILGPDQIRWLELPSLGAEDFGFYQELIPGAIVRLGVGPSDERHRHPLHSSLFDVDESAIPVGAKFMARSGLELALCWPDRLT
ncbi:MAG: M20 metallopeptidase family protein [Planctomycetota bacterium]|jgi:amidohydrolase